MIHEPNKHSWWQTLPGILTATAGIVSAITGLIIAIYQVGGFQETKQNSNETYTASPVTKPNSNSIQPQEKRDESAASNQVADPSTQNPEIKELDNPDRMNLFAPENGVQLLVASSDDWKETIDGKEDWAQITYGVGKEAVYGFKDEREATFDTFTMLISETEGYNVKEFELLAGNDSPTGSFKSIDKFQTQNVKLFKTPYQEYKFPEVKAKYLKIKIISIHDCCHPAIHEFQLFGRLI